MLIKRLAGTTGAPCLLILRVTIGALRSVQPTPLISFRSDENKDGDGNQAARCASN